PPTSTLFPYTTLFRSNYGGPTRPRKDAGQAAPLRLEQERNVPNVRERFHGVLFASASGDSAHFVPSGGWLHALRLTFAKTITGRSEEHTSELQSRFDL